jgi:hypothetical protein
MRLGGDTPWMEYDVCAESSCRCRSDVVGKENMMPGAVQWTSFFGMPGAATALGDRMEGVNITICKIAGARGRQARQSRGVPAAAGAAKVGPESIRK